MNARRSVSVVAAGLLAAALTAAAQNPPWLRPGQAPGAPEQQGSLSRRAYAEDLYARILATRAHLAARKQQLDGVRDTLSPYRGTGALGGAAAGANDADTLIQKATLEREIGEAEAALKNMNRAWNKDFDLFPGPIEWIDDPKMNIKDPYLDNSTYPGVIRYHDMNRIAYRMKYFPHTLDGTPPGGRPGGTNTQAAVKGGKPGAPGKSKGFFVSLWDQIRDWYCTNRPVIEMPVAVPPAVRKDAPSPKKGGTPPVAAAKPPPVPPTPPLPPPAPGGGPAQPGGGGKPAVQPPPEMPSPYANDPVEKSRHLAEERDARARDITRRALEDLERRMTDLNSKLKVFEEMGEKYAQAVRTGAAFVDGLAVFRFKKQLQNMQKSIEEAHAAAEKALETARAEMQELLKRYNDQITVPSMRSNKRLEYLTGKGQEQLVAFWRRMNDLFPLYLN